MESWMHETCTRTAWKALRRGTDSVDLTQGFDGCFTAM